MAQGETGAQQGDNSIPPGLSPAAFCSQLLTTLGASEGRRQRRARNTTPDALGMAMKRDLLEAAVREEPASDAFEHWLLQRCLAAGMASGAVRAMALAILHEWRLAMTSPAFRRWLDAGAPSDDLD